MVGVLDSGVGHAADADQEVSVVVKGDLVDRVVVVRYRQACNQRDRVIEIRAVECADLSRVWRRFRRSRASVGPVLTMAEVQANGSGRVVGIERNTDEIVVALFRDADMGSLTDDVVGLIELDGGYLDMIGESDCSRQSLLEANGWTVLRFRNEDVIKDSDAVAIAIAKNQRPPHGVFELSNVARPFAVQQRSSGRGINSGWDALGRSCVV